MALGSDEAAVLEIEVDVQGFDQQMSSVEARAERAQKAQTRATEREQKKQAIAVAAGIVAWKKFFDFLETGTSEGSAKLRAVTADVDTLKKSLAGAAADGLSPLTDGMLELTGASKEATTAMAVLGRGLLAAASGPLSTWAALVGLMREAAMLGGIDNNSRVTGVTEPGNEWASMVGRAGGFSSQPTARPSGQRAGIRTAAPRPRGGGGGGGGGAETLGQSPTERFEAIREWNQRVMDEARTAAQSILDAADAQALAWTDKQAMQRAGALDKFAAQQRAMQELEIFRWEQTEAAGAKAEATKQQAIEQTIAAMEMSAAALAKGGPAAQAASRLLMLALAGVAAMKAAFEVGEGLAAAARYDGWGAAGHFAAAVQYGIVAGQKASAALGGGGGRSNAAEARGLGGGTMSSPRGTSEGGGGPINVTLVLNAAGEVVDDSALRRLGRAISEIERRGYVARGN